MFDYNACSKLLYEIITIFPREKGQCRQDIVLLLFHLVREASTHLLRSQKKKTLTRTQATSVTSGTIRILLCARNAPLYKTRQSCFSFCLCVPGKVA